MLLQEQEIREEKEERYAIEYTVPIESHTPNGTVFARIALLVVTLAHIRTPAS